MGNRESGGLQRTEDRKNVLKLYRNRKMQEYACKGCTVEQLARAFKLATGTVVGILAVNTLHTAKNLTKEEEEAEWERVQKIRRVFTREAHAAGYSDDALEYMLDYNKETSEEAKRLAELQEKYDKQGLELKKALQENQALRQQLENSAQSFKQQAEQMKQDNLVWESLVAELNKTGNKSENKSESLKAEIEQLKAELEQSKKEALTNKLTLADSKTRSARLVEENERLQAEREELRGEVESLGQGLEKQAEDIIAFRKRVREEQTIREKAAMELQKRASEAKLVKLEAELLAAKEKPVIEEPVADSSHSGIKVGMRVYTDADCQVMVAVYADSNYMLYQALEMLHSQGITVSDRHLATILKKLGVYKYKSKNRATKYQQKNRKHR